MLPSKYPPERGVCNILDGLIVDSCQSFGHLFLALRVAFPENGHPVCLRGTAAMYIRDGVGAFKGKLFGQPVHPDAVLDRDRVYTLHVFLEQFTYLRVGKISVRGQIRDITAAGVNHQPYGLGKFFAFVNFGGVGENRVYEVVAGGLFLAFIGRGETATIERLGPVDHVDDLLFEVTGLDRSVVVHHSEGCPDHTVYFTGLAAAVALPVERGEFYDHISGKFGLSAQEDAIPGDEYVIEDEGRAVFGIVYVTDITAFEFTHIEGGSADNVYQPLCIGRDGEGDRVVCIRLGHCPCGENYYLVG